MNQAELIGKIIEISHSNLDLAARVNAILNIISQDLGFEDVMVYTFDKDKRLTCRYSNQKSILFGILSHYRCHIGEGIIGSVAQRRSPQFFTIKDISPRFGCLFYPELDDHLDKFRTFSFLPLSDDSYLFGVIVLCSYSHDRIQDQEKVLLSVISRELGGILRSFRAHSLIEKADQRTGNALRARKDPDIQCRAARTPEKHCPHHSQIAHRLFRFGETGISAPET